MGRRTSTTNGLASGASKIRHGSFNPDLSPVPVFVHRKRMTTRVVTSGPVGPELDWSVKFSDVPKAYLESRGLHGKWESWFPKPLYYKVDPRDLNYAATRPMPGCIRTYDVTPEGVQSWTKFCLLEGIEYSGLFGYKFPSKKVLSERRFRQLNVPVEKRREFFCSQKSFGFIPKCKRSKAAREARHLKWKARTFTYTGPVVVPRYTNPSRDYRKGWRSNLTCSFSAYRIKNPRHSILVLRFGKKPVPLSGPVDIALRKIYSTTRRYKKAYAFENQKVPFWEPLGPPRLCEPREIGPLAKVDPINSVIEFSTIPHLREDQVRVLGTLPSGSRAALRI